MQYSIEVTYFFNSQGWGLFASFYHNLESNLDKREGFVRCSYHLNTVLRRATVFLVFSNRENWKKWLGSEDYAAWDNTIAPYLTIEPKFTPHHYVG